MDRNRITRTGARTPGGERASLLEWRCLSARRLRHRAEIFTLKAWGLAGRTPAQMNEAISAAIARKELPPMEPGAMCYMMSKEGYGGDSSPHWPSHLMFFYTDTDPATWGANLPGSPVVGVNDPVEHLTQYSATLSRDFSREADF